MRIALLVLVLLLPATAHAYSFTCNDVLLAAQSGDPQTQGAIVGEAYGVADVVGGLFCLVGAPTCNCLSNIVEFHNTDYASAFAQQINSCLANNPNDPAFLSAMRAARQICG